MDFYGNSTTMNLGAPMMRTLTVALQNFTFSMQHNALLGSALRGKPIWIPKRGLQAIDSNDRHQQLAGEAGLGDRASPLEYCLTMGWGL